MATFSCPNCDRNYSEGYQKGYNDAFEQFKDELSLARLQRPLVIKVENATLVDGQLLTSEPKETKESEGA